MADEIADRRQETAKVPPEWYGPFLAKLADTGNVSEACKAAGVCRATAYRYRDNDPTFAGAWEDSIDGAVDTLESEATRRARDGTDEPVFYKGEVVGQVRKYSDTLLIFLLKAHRPEKYRDNYDLKRFIEETMAKQGGT